MKRENARDGVCFLCGRDGQRKVMIEQGWTVDEFRFHFGKNYLDDEELEEIAAIQAESA